MLRVALHWLLMLSLVASCLGAAFLAQWFIRARGIRPLNHRHLARIMLVGEVLLLWAALGPLGWSIQTFDGNSAAENLNDALLKVTSWVGAVLILFEAAWRQAHTGDNNA